MTRSPHDPHAGAGGATPDLEIGATVLVESGLVFAEIELAQGRRAQARRRAAAAFAASTPATAPMVEAWRRAHPGL